MVNNPTAEYWKKRFEQLEQSQHNMGVQAYADIEQQYRKAQRQIEGQINAWYGRFANNNNVTIEEARRMLTAKELDELKWDVHEYIKYAEDNALSGQWVKELENASARYHISRLEALKLQTQQSLEVMFGNQLDTFDDTMSQVYKSGFYRTAFELQKGIGVGWDFGTLDDAQIAKVINKPWAADGKNFSQRVWGNRTKLVNELNQTLTRNIVLGQDPQKAIDEIAKKMNTSKHNAGRLVMTEEAFFSSEAQRDCFKELDVEEYEIVATLDSHTSDICQDMDGKHFKMSQWEVGTTAPPFHVYCRSTTVPYFADDFGVPGERAARMADGEPTYHVPADMTYKQWQKSFLGGGNKSGLKPVVQDDIIKGTKEAIKTIDDCKSTDDVVQLMKSHDDWFYEKEINGKVIRSVDGINLNGVDLESAKAVYKPFEILYEKYPFLKGKLNAVSSSKLDGTVYAQCMVGLGNGGITVNTQYFGNYEKLMNNLKRDIAQGFHPQGIEMAESIVMHELGHAVDDYLTNTLNVAGFNGWKPKYVSAMLRPKVMKSAGFKVSDTRKQVSGYATKDSKEWFAECFSEYMLSENPRPVAMEFGKQLEEIFNEFLKGGE